MIQQDAVTGIGFRGTPGSLGVTACHLMKRPDIQAYINKLRSDHKKEYIMTREEALAYLTKAATEDPDDASMTSKTCEVQYVGMHGTPSPKQFSKKDALTLLGKFQGWEAPTKLTVEFEHIDFE